MSMFPARIACLSACVLVVSVLGCGPAVDVPGQTDAGTEGGSGTEGEGTDGATATGGDPTEGGGGTEGEGVVWINERNAVDVLFVIDNSGSMGEEQTNLSQNIAGFVSVLESEDIGPDYRIGVTTTDNGNFWCQTGPEAGNLVLSSCRSRLNDFIFQGQSEIDASNACTDFCPEAWQSIEIQPTPTPDDLQPKARPWVQNIGGQTNLPDGLDTTTALQCLLPQGINGCGFESHLESMYKTLRRAASEDEDEFGFNRPRAVLAVVFVTDEVDCSYNNEHESIFLPDGLRTFWSLPDEASPTSAVCWNAGVECIGGGSLYDDCHSVDLDPAGSPVNDPDAAVLRPVSRYIDLLQAIEDQKRELDPGQEVIVTAINGVPTNYGDTQEIVYQDAPGGTPNDPAFQDNFGIGPGCVSTVAEAVPPVRLRELAEAFQIGNQPNLFSVCNENYAPALETIANQIRDQIRPACMPACVADADPVAASLQPECTLVQSWTDAEGVQEVVIPLCEDGGVLPEGVDVCYLPLTDDGAADKATPDGSDDMSIECIEQGWNLEFRFVRRGGVPVPTGARIGATCQLSQNKALDCPLLP